MLVLTRKTQQQIQIGEHITITIVRIKGQTVRVGIEAPKDIRVIRDDVRVARDDVATLTSPLAPGMDDSPGDDASQAVLHPPIDVRRRIPGASSAPSIRRPQRLGPASLGSSLWSRSARIR
jgi:carbon storage regulator CsrA